MTAADAATAPNPSANRTSGAQTPSPQPPKSTEATRAGATLGQKAAQTTAQVRQTSEGIARGSKRFGEAVWGPFVKLSGVLWLELTGVFFGLFLMTCAINTWKLRGDLHETALNHTAHQHLFWSAGLTIVFGYFCVSSFVRAARRGRRR